MERPQLTVEEMVALNNERRLQLNEENLKYYEDMLIYLRTSRIPQRRAEELLLEMLDHLLEAQREGRKAQDVFGDDPQKYCQEIVASMEPRSLVSFPRYAFISLILLYIGFIVDGLFRLLVYPVLHVFMDVREPAGFKVDWFMLALLGPLVLEGMLFFMRLTTFRRYWIQVAGMVLFQLLLIGGFVLLNVVLRNHNPVLPISAWMSLIIGIMIWLLHRVLFKGMFKHLDIF